MNKCTDNDVRDVLPDLLHGALAPAARERVKAHLVTCEECREDLQVLGAVKSAAVFEPTIDVDRVVRQIPPYRTIVPAVELPARPRLVSWLVAASLAIAVVGVGSVIARQDATKAPTSVAATLPSAKIPPQPTQVASKTPDSGTSSGTAAASQQQSHTHALALAADVDGLSDGNLVQLMNDMNRFDALPATEPDPVISVDSGY